MSIKREEITIDINADNLDLVLVKGLDEDTVATLGDDGGDVSGLIDVDVLGLDGAAGVHGAEVVGVVDDGNNTVAGIHVDGGAGRDDLGEVSVEGNADGASDLGGEGLDGQVVHLDGGGGSAYLGKKKEKKRRKRKKKNFF